MMVKHGVDPTSVEGLAESPYLESTGALRVTLHSPKTAIPVLWWRSVVLSRDRVVRFRSLDRVATRVDLGGLFAFLRSGLEQPPPDVPARSRVIPTARDWLRFMSNALRYGIRTPKS
jgi:hypothetical protein